MSKKSSKKKLDRAAQKRALRVHLTLLYTFMTLLVIVLVMGIYYVIQGYRFNQYNGKVEQGGLVQFNSQPGGADVWLDKAHLTFKTQSRLTVGTGKHTVAMWKDGYNNWQKDVVVKAGQVLWLDYVRLVPQKLVTTDVLSLAGASSSKISYNTKKLVMFENAASADMTLVYLDSDKPEKQKITLDPQEIAAPAAGEAQDFTVYAWAYDDRYVLVKHTVGQTVEWLSVNTDNQAVKNITKAVGLDFTGVQYAKNDANTLFALTKNNEVRQISVDQKTISGPLLTNIKDFNLYDPSTIVFTTNADSTTNKRTAGYLTIGASKPRTVYQTAAGDTGDLALRINKYYGQYYEVVQSGDLLTIYTGDLSASDASDPAPFTNYATMSGVAGSQEFGFSPDQHRFIYLRRDAKIFVFDLDLEAESDITLSAVPTSGVDWADEFHIATIENGVLRFYDYDGTNSHDLMKNVIAGDVSLLQSGKCIYALTNNNGTLYLSRVQMIN